MKPGLVQDFYFEETYGKTLEMIQRGRLATSLARGNRWPPGHEPCYRESMRPAGIAHKAHTLFYDRNLWGDMELYRGNRRFRVFGAGDRPTPAPCTEIGSGLEFAALRTRAATEAPDASTPASSSSMPTGALPAPRLPRHS